MNAILELTKHGQSIWYDYIQRAMIWTGALHRMAREDGLRGVTSNPAIFEKAIGGSKDYDAAVRAVVVAGASPAEIFERLAMQDIQLACDVLRGVYEETKGVDGYVSFEVSPHLAHDTAGTLADARRVWRAIDRENLMVKIPATPEGIPAIEAAIADGINVNVTLLFAVDAYEAVAEAYVRGLEKLVARGGDPSKVASVASFFVSRIDVLVDKLLDERIAAGAKEGKERLEALRGKVAVANAKIAYESYEQLVASERWQKLAAKGAKPQRLLWASTGTKNPAYRDVVYVEELIGPDTVNTVPEQTYLAFKDHGRVRASLKEDLAGAKKVMSELAAVDVSIEHVTKKLLADGVVLFADAFDRLIGTVEKRRREILGATIGSVTTKAAGFEKVIAARLEQLRTSGFTRRLWAKDATLFTSSPAEARSATGFMNWMGVVDAMLARPEPIADFTKSLRSGGFEQVALMGMGGSSLAPEVFTRTFGKQPGAPELVVLDSTVPAQVATFEKKVRLDKTLFVVASKSGSTTEPLVFDKYFFDRVKKGEQFWAITDPGSKLEKMAKDRHFRGITSGDPEIGGRYSALSPFGMVAAAAMGMDTRDLLSRAQKVVHSSGPEVPPAQNAGVELGAILGELALAGRDKLTLVSTPTLAAFGAWLEQLVAESTGKHGKGIVPVDGEVLAGPELYDSDRVFAYLALREERAGCADLEAKLAALEAAGHPVIRVELADRRDLVQEMYRWEIATATAGHVLGINPFDQPNVQESKDFTSSLLAKFSETGKLPPIPGEVKLVEGDGLAVYTDEKNAKALGVSAGSVKDVLRAHLARVSAGDYVAFNAYVEMNAASDAQLQAMRHDVRAKQHVATTVGYGPRFLHSTGQLHKGGANNGVFLQITSADAVDLPIAGEKYSYSVLKAAQEAGDFMALSMRERRLVRVHLGADVQAGLQTLAGLLGA
jgi:transaldolase/glucose-6-phosphate isomerase